MRILILEDNVRLAALMSERLRKVGYVVDFTATVDAFKDFIASYAYDLFILDLGLPDGDGINVILRLRKSRVTAPILIVTGRCAIESRVSGLNSGADDYLVKPFHEAELLARIGALLRRPRALAPKRVKVGRVVLDCNSGELQCSGQRIELRPSERRLLALLVQRAGRVVPRDAIEGELRGAGHEATPNAIEQVVSRLRKSLGDRPASVRIKTVRGAGYVLEESVHQ